MAFIIKLLGDIDITGTHFDVLYSFSHRKEKYGLHSHNWLHKPLLA